MPNRPAIPAELRRRILVEAGHRCAIHTCRSSDVDVHHIVPWEQCQEHAYENLVALCPNCHRRADAGEIDRKSLRLYKARLAAAVGISSAPDEKRQIPGAKIATRQRWVTSLIEESQAESVPYEISVEFPQFLPDEGDLAELNVIVQASALSTAHEYRRHRIMLPIRGIRSESPPDGYWESFEVSLLDDNFISVRYSVAVYGTGAAHPNHFTRTANYQRNPLIPLHLSDFFTDESAAIAGISRYTVDNLAGQKQLDQPDEWVVRGAGPDPNNFQAFNILPHGLLFTFDPYQVGAYAEGPYQVNLPPHELAPFMRSGTSVAALWKVGSKA